MAPLEIIMQNQQPDPEYHATNCPQCGAPWGHYGTCPILNSIIQIPVPTNLETERDL